MNIAIQIPQVLTRYTDGRSSITVSACTVLDALLALQREYPPLYQCVCDESGAVRRHINVFINRDFVRDRNGLQTVLVEGDVLSVFQAVSGG